MSFGRENIAERTALLLVTSTQEPNKLSAIRFDRSGRTLAEIISLNIGIFDNTAQAVEIDGLIYDTFLRVVQPVERIFGVGKIRFSKELAITLHKPYVYFRGNLNWLDGDRTKTDHCALVTTDLTSLDVADVIRTVHRRGIKISTVLTLVDNGAGPLHQWLTDKGIALYAATTLTDILNHPMLGFYYPEKYEAITRAQKLDRERVSATT